MNVRPIDVKIENHGGSDEKIIVVPSSHLTQRYQNVQVTSVL